MNTKKPLPVEVVLAGLYDQDDLATLRRAAGWEVDSVPGQFLDQRRGNRLILLAYYCPPDYDAVLAGTTTIEWIGPDRMLSDGATVAHLNDTTVLERYRGRGVHEALVVEAERRAQERGVALACQFLHAGLANWYRRRGYRDLGTVNGFQRVRRDWEKPRD